MDVQLKRGLLDVCVLAAIKSEDSYGYRIIKDLRPCLELSESTLYTILKRLEGAGMLTVRTAEHDGRLRKYYRITDEGRKRLADFKEEWKEIKRIYQFVVKEEEHAKTSISGKAGQGVVRLAAGRYRRTPGVLQRDGG